MGTFFDVDERNKSIKLMDTILDRSIDQLKIGRNKYSRESE